jgi:ankyrin repeat protein
MRRVAINLPTGVRSALRLTLAGLALAAAGACAHGDPRDLEAAWGDAMKAKDLTAIGQLLEAGADPAWTATGGRTALMFAAEGGDLGLVEQLLEAGASVEAMNQYRGNALMFAAKGGDVPVTRRLIAAGADVNHVADLGWTALLVAAAKGNADVSLALIEAGANPNAQDKNGWTPLMHAVSGRHLATAAALLEVPAVDPDLREENGSTALHIAALGGNEPMVRLLVDHGADVAAKTAMGFTPAEVADAARHPALAAWLESAAASRTP